MMTFKDYVEKVSEVLVDTNTGPSYLIAYELSRIADALEKSENPIHLQK